MKTAIYARVSTADQDASTQEKQCRDYCERLGYEVIRVYTDNGVSGIKASRPAFNELLADMRLMRFGCVVVTRLDRMGRSLQHLLSLIDEFTGKGVHFIAVTQNIDTTSASGKLQLQILGSFAEYERNIISERTRESLKYCKNVGKRGADKKPRQKRGVLRRSLPLVSGKVRL